MNIEMGTPLSRTGGRRAGRLRGRRRAAGRPEPGASAAPVGPAARLRPDDLHRLQILTEISREGNLSQRALALRLGMAVGLVNAFIRKLVRKGYVKATTMPPRRMKYLLTPRGAMEKLRLTYEFLSFSYRYFREAHRNASNLFHDLARQGVRRLAFYGAEDIAEVAALSLADSGLELAAVADDEAAGRTWLGRKVISLDDLDGVKFDRIVLTTVRRRQDRELAARLAAKGPVLRIY